MNKKIFIWIFVMLLLAFAVNATIPIEKYDFEGLNAAPSNWSAVTIGDCIFNSTAWKYNGTRSLYDPWSCYPEYKYPVNDTRYRNISITMYLNLTSSTSYTRWASTDAAVGGYSSGWQILAGGVLAFYNDTTPQSTGITPSLNNGFYMEIILDKMTGKWHGYFNYTNGTNIFTVPDKTTATHITYDYQLYVPSGGASQKNYIDLVKVYDCDIWTSPCSAESNVAAPAADTSNIDILFWNSTAYTNTFNEGQELYTYLNYTFSSNGSNISNGVCNVTFINASIENASLVSNFTLCSSGCNYTIYTEQFSILTNTSFWYDDIYFNACHLQTNSKGINVTAQCIGNSYSKAFTSADMPSCPSTAMLHVPTAICNASNKVNVSISTDAGNSQRKQITDLHFDRFFYSDYLNMTFNASTGLYQNNEITHEYYLWGNKTIYANCSNPSSSLDKNVNDSIVIVNDIPVIYFNKIDTSLGQTLLANNSIIEFANGSWEFGAGASDSNLMNITYRIQNPISLIYNVTYNTSTLFNLSSNLFADFNNSYIFNISATDSFGNRTFSWIYFNVTDTHNPTYTGLINDTTLNGTSYNFTAMFYDEYLWSFYMNCSNNDNFSRTSIAATSYYFTNLTSILITNITCSWNLSDGHTASMLTKLTSDKLSTDKDNNIVFDGTTLRSLEPMAKLTYDVLYDRVSFCYTPAALTDKMTIPIPFGCVAAPNSKWKGHIICDDKYAVDFENKQGYDVKIVGKDIIIYIKDGMSMLKPQEVCFNSIVELNTVYGITTVNLTYPLAPGAYINGTIPHDWTFDMDIETTPGVLLLFFYLALICCVFIAGLVLRVPFLVFIASMMTFFLGYIIAFKVSILFGIMIALVGLVLLIVGALML